MRSLRRARVARRRKSRHSFLQVYPLDRRIPTVKGLNYSRVVNLAKTVALFKDAPTPLCCNTRNAFTDHLEVEVYVWDMELENEYELTLKENRIPQKVYLRRGHWNLASFICRQTCSVWSSPDARMEMGDRNPSRRIATLIASRCLLSRYVE